MAHAFLSERLQYLEQLSETAHRHFGELTPAQFNWKPAPDRWSIAQCLDHLIVTNHAYRPVLEGAVNKPYHTFWERLPLLPGLFGRMLLQATTPDRKSKMKTTGVFEPAQSDLPADIVTTFLQHNRDLSDLLGKLRHVNLEKTIITSPASSVIVYSLRDAIQVITQHEERHLNQARQVMKTTGFPETD